MTVPGSDSKDCAAVLQLDSCSNSCLFCNPERQRRYVTEKRLKILEMNLLSQVLSLRRQGYHRSIEISGSDPLEYGKIAPFIEYLKTDLGFQSVVLSTHGRLLRDLRLVRELSRAGLDQLRIPLYGSRESIHDSVTQEKGSFQETLKGIRNVRRHAPHIHITVTSLVMKQNYKDALGIFLLACRYASCVYFSVPFIKRMKDAGKFVVSFWEMKPYLQVLLAVSDKTDKPFEIMDVPFCVFGFYRENIRNKTGPPAISASFSIPSQDRSRTSALPAYRIKKKPSFCRTCSLGDRCDGFYVRYLRLFGSKGFTPLATPAS